MTFSQPASEPEWLVSPQPVPYPKASLLMETRVDAIIENARPEMIWLLQHPPLYTKGTSADPAELKDAARFPVFETGRGGRYTYHGPGQRVIYTMLDLRNRGKDIHAHVQRLEQWVIQTLAEFGVKAEQRQGRVGLWVSAPADGLPQPWRAGAGGGGNPPQEQSPHILHAPLPNPPREGEGKIFVEEKIAAIGVRVRKWVAYHGLALNIEPDLSHFSGIVPCGISSYGVTSLRKLGVNATMEEVDAAFKRNIGALLG